MFAKKLPKSQHRSSVARYNITNKKAPQQSSILSRHRSTLSASVARSLRSLGWRRRQPPPMAHCLKHKGNYSDEFWMLSFKVVPCTKTYAHSWSSCPCAHPGETARRRDPTLFNYQPVLCPNVKSKSGCPAGDSCGYAHNVFEQWLHPQRYKALMCTYGSQCTRPSCFFAHSLEELRVPWKGGTGTSSGGDQQQAQQQQQSQPFQRSPGSSGAPCDGDAAGVLGQLGAAGGAAGSESDAAAAAAAAAAVRSASVSVSGHAAAAAAAAAGAVNSGGSGSIRPRLVLQASAGLQQQLQHMQRGGLLSGGGGGGGVHSVVDVRMVAAGSAGQSLSSDHALLLNTAQSSYHHHPQQQSRRSQQSTSIGSVGPVQHRGSVTASASAPYELDTSTFVPLESTSLGLVSGPPNRVPSSSQLQRTLSNASTLYTGLTEEMPLTAAPATVPSGTGGGAVGTTADIALAPSESTSATSLYHTPGSTSHHQLTQPLIGPYHVNPAAGQGGGVGGSVGSGPGGWLSHVQQQSGGLDFGQTGGGGGSGTASLDFTGVPPSTSLAAHSSTNLLDTTEEAEPSGLLSGWVTVALPSGSHHQVGQGQTQQQQQQQQQVKQPGLQLGPVSPFTSGGQRAGPPPRSYSARLSEDPATAAAAAVQQLQLSGTGQQQLQQGAQPAAGGGNAAAAAGVLGAGTFGNGGLNPQVRCIAVWCAARIDPEVEMLLLSSLQLQLSHAGVASHPVVASFPVRTWLQQALQGRGQAATRAYLLDLLAQYMPPDQLGVIRRLLDCLDEAGSLLSCFAGPVVAPPAAHGSVAGGGVASASALGGGPAGTGAGPS
ncbi:hypothetical protein VOLCADRAFT_94607 [Volvox carteri f. nagariensis]|uniref:C3H1-type domain-containing protein n=1 Tax=Volvox carteri f. nagariensis TaxID=3068 RepID=D8U587_VOLCA|nr:uncharacterized protein VOLCADRAFT_94607 [Volvox carteri f. nagariensis]EFJ45109.1 hypothetical protein VOLCADRAFT_94607 [Volvox carteri f. nagariensis]|eukprot:XP_002953785.1 hypothetical protein VOLCADRAFT_94607 [Volvox carteri f. nagariensis]